jgi:NAD(P)-dependent dehydrogenase (short-subunit alcohol dehydrogenase family)
MSGIKGKVVAITGASGGIGEAAALLLAGLGAKVVLGARRVDRLQALAARIAAAGAKRPMPRQMSRGETTSRTWSSWPASGLAGSTSWSATPASGRSRASTTSGSRIGRR